MMRLLSLTSFKFVSALGLVNHFDFAWGEGVGVIFTKVFSSWHWLRGPLGAPATEQGLSCESADQRIQAVKVQSRDIR